MIPLRGGARAVKRSAAIAITAFVCQIVASHGEQSLVSVDIDLGVLPFNDDWLPTYDWGWLLFALIVIYLIALHLVAFYFLGGKIIVRVRARFAVRTS